MNDVSNNYLVCLKKFWTYIKSKGQDLIGIPTLKNGFIKSDSHSKANILNE